MKIIDLLNKIANGEEVPNFKIDGEEYYIKNRCVFSKLTGNSISWAIYQGWLNEEIEIIEEPKKMEKLENQIDTSFIEFGYSERKRLTEMVNKINEIIDKINEGENNE